MKILVILILVGIGLSLGSAAFFLIGRQGPKERLARALTIRVGLSIALFLLLMAGYGLGWFKPNHHPSEYRIPAKTLDKTP